MSNKVIDAIKTADMIVRELLAIQAGEEVVLVADPETDMEMVQAISGIAQAVGAECTIAVMPSRPVEESLQMTRFIDRIERERSLLMKLELSVLSYSLVASLALIFLHAQIGRPELLAPVQIALFILNLMCGALVGSEFPLANKIFLKAADQVSEVAGTLYASDLLGAWMGALLASIVLIPVLGIPQTCLLVAAVKFVSLVLVSLSSPA